MRRGIYGLLLGAAVLMAFCTGCVARQEKGEVAELEYTVVKPAEIPATLAARIEEEKEAGFVFTYSDNAYLYIARGYGEKETGGYSIQVKECSLGENAIYVKCALVGPAVGEKVNAAPSYPYIVLKTELCEKKVVFE